MIGAVLAVMRLTAFAASTAALLVVYLPLRLLGRGASAFQVLYWQAVARLILRMTIVVRGELARERPLMCVANHAGYLDIIALGALIPGFFVAKKDVRAWPGIGLLARAVRTAFVDRDPLRVKEQREALLQRLYEGEPMILFPEGTSSDGNRVLPFKSSLFSIAAGGPGKALPWVQPVSIAYTRQSGLPMGRAARPTYSWFGGMDLAPHLWKAMQTGRFTVEVDFLPPTTLKECGDRKVLAASCEQAVRQAFNDALTGRSAGAGVARSGKNDGSPAAAR